VSIGLYTVVINDLRINGVVTYTARHELINRKIEPISDIFKNW